MLVDPLERRLALEKLILGNMTMEWSADRQRRQTCGKGQERELHPSLQTADAFPVVASLAIFRRERSDDRKCVCCSQASCRKDGRWGRNFGYGGG